MIVHKNEKGTKVFIRYKNRISAIYTISVGRYMELSPFFIIWFLKGKRKPSLEEQTEVESLVTFIFKSFERQTLAKRLYRNIRSFYPNAQIIIADDSKTPLVLKEDDHLTIIQLPFNSGLSYGLQLALDQIKTPFVFRMDDDELLTLHTDIGKQLDFLDRHPEVDLVSVLPFNAIKSFIHPEKVADDYYGRDMSYAKKQLLIPHQTIIENDYVVLGKVPNIYLVRTEKLKQIGFDPNIRMLDHNYFFYRAAGNIVSVLNLSAYVFHSHNPFLKEYKQYRSDVEGDRAYIRSRILYDTFINQEDKEGNFL